MNNQYMKNIKEETQRYYQILSKDFPEFLNDYIDTPEMQKLDGINQICGAYWRKKNIYEDMKTKESIFAKMCDKLEADIQCKLYCEENCIDINKKENECLLKDARIKKLLEKREKTVADLFIENDRPIYTEKIFENIANFIKKNDLLKLKKEK